MDQSSKTLRIDEILLWDGLVNEEQIKAALEQQRGQGGRLGSHLLRLGYVTEAQLLSALSKQSGCPSIVLSQVAVPPQVLQFIPANVAVARLVMPFAYDEASDTLSVACEDPTDEELLKELQFVAQGKKIKLFVAAELPLRAALAEYYQSGCQKRTPAVGGHGALPTMEGTAVLLVTDDPEADRPIHQALVDEEFQVVSIDSADDAIGLIGRQEFHAVFIRDTVPGDYLDLIDRLRKVSPSTRVRFFESPASILLHDSGYRVTEDLVHKNMQLFTTLLASVGKLDGNHSAVVGQYVDKLCRLLELPEKDRMHIVNAAYLHDISRYYYGESEAAPDCRARVKMTAKLLESLDYPPLVVEMLKSMYIDLEEKYTKRLPIEALGGNIITTVDIFCETVRFDKRMSLDKFETVRNNMMTLSGHLFLKEVVEAFLQMVEEEILVEPECDTGVFNQVLMLCEDMDYLTAIAGRLREEGFRPVSLDNVAKFVEMYQRSKPDIMILLHEGQAAESRELIRKLSSRGVEVGRVPTFLITDRQAAAELAPVLELGLEDIIPLENSLDLLVAKMQRLRDQILGEAVDDATGDEGAKRPDEGKPALKK
jgi:DNA-binding response OmpR family regulator